MAGPYKPLPMDARNFRNPHAMLNYTSSLPNGGVNGLPGMSTVRTQKNPPPLPPRHNRRIIPTSQNRSSVYPVMGNYSYPGYNQFSHLGMGFAHNYGSYGGYNRLGSYGYGNSYNGYPMNNVDSRFIQLAEERARPAFQSIESVLQTFSAISLMLDSTFMAMHTSFHAVLGVAENFAKLRSFLRQFLSTIATFKLIRWFYRHILYFLGLVSQNATKEELWQEALHRTASDPLPSTPQNRLSIPVIMFMGLMLTGPYIIFKLLNSLYSSEQEETAWNPSVDPYQLVRAVYDFQGQAEGELSFQQGQTLKMAPLKEADQTSGWALVADQYNRIGYAPINRLSLGPLVQNNHQNNQSQQSQPLTVPKDVNQMNSPETPTPNQEV
ncbi:peroxisomal membrane protein PEX13 isoform X2 [Bemisia tabaci]|uniref:peroxisomal membrane protein PEX13 isoform X2 n=1 Tax=Bemisia tabaci TaxID=7038 RepID=UPI0008F98B52|nr:PREDICTED: probable peroxisomal membrane protein PEX13 isoform X2 [Bemisia tabaci]